MDKNNKNDYIYKLKNDNNIPDSVRSKLNSTYEDILSGEVDIENIGKKSRYKKRLIRVSAVASLVTIFTIGMYNPSLADNIPILSSMLDKFQIAIKNNNKIKNDISIINESSYINGLNITVDKAMYDGNNIYMEFTLKTDKPFKETEYNKCINYENSKDLILNFYYPEFKLNQKKPSGYSFEMPKAKFVDDYTLKVSTVFEFPAITNINNNTIDFEMDLYLASDAVDENLKSEVLDGIWKFKFPISSNKSNSKTIDVDQTKNGFRLNKVMISKTSVSIDITAPRKYYKDYDIMEAVEVKDNKGNCLWATSGNYYNDKSDIPNPRYTQRYDLKSIGDDIKYITVTFYGKWDEKTKSAPILADFKVNTN